MRSRIDQVPIRNPFLARPGRSRSPGPVASSMSALASQFRRHNSLMPKSFAASAIGTSPLRAATTPSRQGG